MSRVTGKITEEFVKKLKPPANGQHIEWDDKVPGFGVRINSGGSIAFVLNYSLHKKRRRFKIGRYPAWSATAARERAKELAVGVDKGDDPREQRRQLDSEPTFEDLAKQYLKYAESHKRPTSLRNDDSNIKRLRPQWGPVLLKAIRQRDIEAIHRDLRATPYRANRVLSLLSHMFAKAVEWDLLDASPLKKGIAKRLRFPEEPNQRWLTAEEQGRLNKALDEYSDQRAADVIRLLLLTGSREGEALQADWSQFDLKRGVWVKPSHATKQRRTENLPLSDKAIALLKRLGPKKSGPLFPGADGDARVTIRRPWVQVLRAAGLAQAVERQGKRRKITRYKPTVRLHDLRHTFASELVNKGVSLHLVGRLLGHTQPSTTARYAHASQEALRAAANQFGGTR